MLMHSLKSKPAESLTQEDKTLIETYNKKVDFVDYDSLKQIAECDSVNPGLSVPALTFLKGTAILHIPLMVWRSLYETMHGFGKSAPQTREDRGADPGHRQNDR